MNMKVFSSLFLPMKTIKIGPKRSQQTGTSINLK